MRSLLFLPGEEQWSVLSKAFHRAAMSSYQSKCIHLLPCRTVTKSAHPLWCCVQRKRENSAVRLWGRFWTLSMQLRHSDPKQTLLTYLRWIKRIWLTTILSLFYIMSNHLADVSLEVVELVMVWVGFWWKASECHSATQTGRFRFFMSFFICLSCCFSLTFLSAVWNEL